MAEFKLGRIRFIWKNDWIASTVYYNDDIVRNGGNTYVCVAGHTAPALFTTLETSYWDKRLANREYDVIQFRNGYMKDAPIMVIPYAGYEIIERNGVIVYSLNLGNIIEKRNCGIFDNAQI